MIRAAGKAFCAGVDVGDHTADKVRAMIELFRGLSEEQQEAFLKATAALAKPIEDVEKKVANG